MLPNRSISRAPRNPTSTTPRCTFIPITSRKPLYAVALYQILASAKPTAVSMGAGFITPISSRAVNRGACVRCASTVATCGNPRPTTTVWPSRSSLAPAVAMISVALARISDICLSWLVVRVALRPQATEVYTAAALLSLVLLNLVRHFRSIHTYFGKSSQPKLRGGSSFADYTSTWTRGEDCKRKLRHRRMSSGVDHLTDPAYDEGIEFEQGH